jgi:hypothetical protein
MSNARNAAIALRTICNDSALRHRLPQDLHYKKCRAHDALDAALSMYAGRLPAFLDHAYNRRCRLDGWHPAPFMERVLPQQDAELLQIDEADERLRERITGCQGFKALEYAARAAQVLLKLSIRADGVAVTCDFRRETEGEVALFLV